MAAAVLWLVGGRLGTEIFPTVDAGQFQLRLRAPVGTRIERTEQIARHVQDRDTGKDSRAELRMKLYDRRGRVRDRALSLLTLRRASGDKSLIRFTNPNDIRAQGGIMVWPAADNSGTPPQTLKVQFPDMVQEVPRSFPRLVQGMLPLIKIGWAMMRPACITEIRSQSRSASSR